MILIFIHFLLEKELEFYKTNPIKEREREREGGREEWKEGRRERRPNCDYQRS